MVCVYVCVCKCVFVKVTNRAFSSWAWLIFITGCGNKILYAESSKLGSLPRKY